MRQKTLLILILIIMVGALLRFYRLGEIPTGLHRDEAFLGYNAYSILKTGKDMSGQPLPLHFQSFLYSPAGYSYATIPFVSIFGLNAFSVRFASALFGTATILTTFFLTLSLFKKPGLALAAAGFLAISPWHINLSRTATENTLVVFFVCLGVFLYLRWRAGPKLLAVILSFLAFGVTLTIYQAPRAFLPIFIPFMVAVLGIPKRHLVELWLLYAVTIVVPLVLILAQPELSLRIKTVSIFASHETPLVLNEQIREDGTTASRLITRIFHNKIVGYTNQLFDNYFAHFSYDFLFTDKGFPDRYRIPSAGILYLFELPLILTGLTYLLRRRAREDWFLLGWMAIVPIGSALTFDDVPNLQRTLLVFPALSLLTAVGARELANLTSVKIIPNRLLTAGKFALIFIGIYNFAFYLHQYYVHTPLHRPWFRHEGYKELVAAVDNLGPKYQKAVITTRESAPTIFFLFFDKYDPQTFQNETRFQTPRDLDRVNFAHYEFSQQECPLRLEEKTDPTTGATITQFVGLPNVLYVNFGSCKTPVSYADEIGEIRRGDNSVVFRLVTPRE